MPDQISGSFRYASAVSGTTTYATVGTEAYSARLCAAYARVARRTLADSGPVQQAEAAALVAGVLHGKRLPRNSVDAAPAMSTDEWWHVVHSSCVVVRDL